MRSGASSFFSSLPRITDHGHGPFRSRALHAHVGRQGDRLLDSDRRRHRWVIINSPYLLVEKSIRPRRTILGRPLKTWSGQAAQIARASRRPLPKPTTKLRASDVRRVKLLASHGSDLSAFYLISFFSHKLFSMDTCAKILLTHMLKTEEIAADPTERPLPTLDLRAR